jgi:hypothetical protein
VEGTRARGEEDGVAAEPAVGAGAVRRDLGRQVTSESRLLANEFDPVPAEVDRARVGHRARDLRRASAEAVDQRIRVDLEANAVDLVAAESGQIQRGLAHRLRGDGALDHRSDERRSAVSIIARSSRSAGFQICRPPDLPAPLPSR